MSPVTAHYDDWPFVSRAQELETLRVCARSAADGGTRVVSVRGEAGVGKTSLVRKFLDELHGFTVLRVSCDEQETDLCYGVVDQITSCRPVGAAHRPRPIAGGTPSADPHAVATRLREFFDRAQAEGPVVLVVDDAQWADRESLDALNFVLRRMSADTVLAVFVTRDGTWADGAPPTPGRPEQTVLIHLGGLTQGEVRDLARRFGHTALDRSAAARLHKNTGGNPLHVVTVLERMSETGGGAEDLVTPTSIGTIIERQLGTLPNSTRRVLEALAVVNAPTTPEVLEKVSGVRGCREALEPARDSGLIEWRRDQPTAAVALRHALHRDAIYTGLTPSRRRQLHTRLASELEGAAALTHRVAAANGTDDTLAAELEQAAETCSATGLLRQAALHLVWAADLSSARADHERRVLLAGRMFVLANDRPGLIGLEDRIARCAPGPERDLVLGCTRLMQGQAEEAEPLLQAAIDAARTVPELGALAAISGTMLTGAHIWQGRAEPALAVGRRALASASCVDRHTAATLHGMIIQALSMRSGPSTALRELPDVFRGIPDDPEVATHRRLWEGLLHLDRGDLRQACADLTSVTRFIKQNRVSSVIRSRGVASLAFTEYLLGQWDDAALDVEHALSLAEAEGKPWDLASAHMVGAFVRSGQGKWAEAREHVAATARLSDTMGSHHEAVVSAIASAAAATAREDPEQVTAALAPLAAMPDDGYRRKFRLFWQPLYVEALIALDDLPRAEAQLADLRALDANPDYLGVVLARLTGELHERRRDLASARAVFTEATSARPARDEAALERALLEHAYGRHLARAPSSRQAAIRWLDKASETFRLLAAAPFLERCRAERVALAASSEDSVPLAQLTARERDVALLVGRGLTNREIGAQLSVSVKTVEYHLANVFAKIGVSSRRQLRDHVQYSSAS